MRADELTVGESYAFVKWAIHQPQRAEVLEDPAQGLVKVRIVHPDLGGEEKTIATKDLANGWFSEPDIDRFVPPGAHIRGEVARARTAGDPLTWKDIADQAYDKVRRSRALADRLTALGIPRVHEHYAGRGGQEGALQAKVQLVLDYDELEQLIGYAEQGAWRPSPSASPSQAFGTVETTT